MAGATNGLKPAVPEAQRARRVIRLARVPTTLSRVYTRERVLPVGRQAGRQADSRARLRGKGESCFDSCEGSRLVGVMRRIEFIGSALDQAGLRSSIKKGSECFGIGRTPAGLFAGSERRSIRSCRRTPEKPPATIFRADHRALSIPRRVERAEGRIRFRRKAFSTPFNGYVSEYAVHACGGIINIDVTRCDVVTTLYECPFDRVLGACSFASTREYKRTRTLVILIKIDEVVK